MRVFPSHHFLGFPMPFWSRESEHVAGFNSAPIHGVSCFVAGSGYVRRIEIYVQPVAFFSL